MSDPAAEHVHRAERLYADLQLTSVRAWKEAHRGRPAIGHLPIYTPREVIAATGALPVGVVGGGDQVDIIRGDACFQSYICHLPRSTVELGLGGELDVLDGVVFPSTCDVIRNLSGIWQVLFPGKLVRYLDLPQCLELPVAGPSYRRDLADLAVSLEKVGGQALDGGSLRTAIAAYNANRLAISRLYDLRAEAPWLVPLDECYLIVRAGNVLPVTEHTALVEGYRQAAAQRDRRREDRVRVVLIGSFCEQPPLGLLRTVERSGCYVVDDDLNLGARWIQGEITAGDDPLDALASAYLTQSTWASTLYEGERPRGPRLVEKVRARNAEGVIFSAPSFCDPALLDQPPLQAALDGAQIPYAAFKYSEDSGQFQSIREQTGAFSDSVRLWGVP